MLTLWQKPWVNVGIVYIVSLQIKNKNVIMHLLWNSVSWNVPSSEEDGCSQFFYIVEYDENEETSCFNLHVITVCGTSFVSRNPSKKRQMSTSPI